MYHHKRDNGVWYFRRLIPKDILGMVDSSLFTVSLRTRNKQESLKFYAAALARSEQEIGYAREKIRKASENGQAKVYPTHREYKKSLAEKAKRKRSRAFCQYDEAAIDSLVSRWMEKKKFDTETIYRDAFALNSADERVKIEHDIDEERMHLMDVVPPMRDMFLYGELRSILDAEDCDPPRDGLSDPLYRRFYSLVLQWLLYLNEIASSLIRNGKLPEQFQRLPAFTSTAPLPSGLNHSSSGGVLIILDELISRFENDPKRQALRGATRAEYSIIYRGLIEEIGGNTPILKITRDHIRAVAETFRHIPSHGTLNSKKRPLKELAAQAKAEGKPLAHVKTYNKKAQQLSAIFKYAVIEQMIPSNPAQNLALPEPPRNGDDKGFTPEQLSLIFSGKLFMKFTEEGNAYQFEPNHHLLPCYFWSPLIALFHGMRSGEILQIRTENIFERDGVAVIKLEGMLKTQPSYRIVPIHPMLTSLGFKDYIENVRKGGYEMAFPDAKMGKDGKYSSWFQKPFSAYLKKIGVKKDRNQTFHSFRHTWNSGLRRVEVPQEIRRSLGGWKDASSESTYGSQYFPNLLKHLEKLTFPELDLTHLLPK